MFGEISDWDAKELRERMAKLREFLNENNEEVGMGLKMADIDPEAWEALLALANRLERTTAGNEGVDELLAELVEVLQEMGLLEGQTGVATKSARGSDRRDVHGYRIDNPLGLKKRRSPSKRDSAGRQIGDPLGLKREQEKKPSRRDASGQQLNPRYRPPWAF